MQRIPPNQKIGKKFEQLMNQGLDGEEDVTTMVIRLGILTAYASMLQCSMMDQGLPSHSESGEHLDDRRFLAGR